MDLGDGFWVGNEEILDRFKSIIIKDFLGIRNNLLVISSILITSLRLPNGEFQLPHLILRLLTI